MIPPIRLALVGLGKIARDQHLPAIAQSREVELVAAVDRHGDPIDGLPFFRDIADLAASGLGVDAVTLCTPPQPRYALASAAIAQGWHVFLEKPPAASLAEVAALCDRAAATGVSLFAGWHSRCAAGVEPARRWLASRVVRNASIVWREDVRIWHPGQAWIWEPGGFGVFDPGINALSIATRILPRPLIVDDAQLDVPGNRAAPIAARVAMRDTIGTPVTMDLDFRQQGPQTWDILVETDAGTLVLSRGGAVLTVPADEPTAEEDAAGEYPRLYRRFADIVRAGSSDVDVAPLRLVADAFLRGRFTTVEDFVE